MLKPNRNASAHLRRHFKKLIKLPGLNNQEIGEKFVNLIDEAFKNYALFQQTQNILEFFSWASDFQAKVNSYISEWISKARGEAGKLLRSLQNKAHQWWYFLAHPEIPPDNNLAERTLRESGHKKKSQWRFPFNGTVPTYCQFIDCYPNLSSPRTFRYSIF